MLGLSHTQLQATAGKRRFDTNRLKLPLLSNITGNLNPFNSYFFSIWGSSDIKIRILNIGQLFTLLLNYISMAFHSNICCSEIKTKKRIINRDRKRISEGLHTLWPASVSEKKASCESTPVTSVSAMSVLHWGLGLSESLVHRSLPVFPVRLIIRACHRHRG